MVKVWLFCRDGSHFTDVFYASVELSLKFRPEFIKFAC